MVVSKVNVKLSVIRKQKKKATHLCNTYLPTQISGTNCLLLAHTKKSVTIRWLGKCDTRCYHFIETRACPPERTPALFKIWPQCQPRCSLENFHNTCPGSGPVTFFFILIGTKGVNLLPNVISLVIKHTEDINKCLIIIIFILKQGLAISCKGPDKYFGLWRLYLVSGVSYCPSCFKQPLKLKAIPSQKSICKAGHGQIWPLPLPSTIYNYLIHIF